MGFLNDLAAFAGEVSSLGDEMSSLAQDAISQVTTVTDGIQDVVGQATSQVDGVVQDAKGQVEEVKSAFGGISINKGE